jgi:hypothetical protein
MTFKVGKRKKQALEFASVKGKSFRLEGSQATFCFCKFLWIRISVDEEAPSVN